MRPESVSLIDRLVQKYGGDINDLKFVPVLYKSGQFAAVIDAGSGEVIDRLAINPWID